MRARYVFPPGFLWGTATAAHQVEGGNTRNTWHAWEQAGRVLEGQRAGRACDWWSGRWREDFDRAAEAGQNAHRLSVEWSRIQPTPDRWDEDALEHYRQMVRGLRERGMTPFVTLHHFTDPLWLAEMGGWENPEAPQFFARFVARVVEALKAYVADWCTINEPNVYTALGYIEGIFPPGKQDVRLALQVAEHLALGHAAAYETIHRLQPEAQVGLVLYYRPMAPARRWFPPDVAVARLQHRWFNHYFAWAAGLGRRLWPAGSRRDRRLGPSLDFFGLNYYTSDRVAFAPRQPGYARRAFPPEAPLSEHGDIAHVPEGMLRGIRWAKRFGVPVVVTENGVEDGEDALRPRYLAEHLLQVWRASNLYWPVKGYFHWTLVDNFEWDRGWTRRFGLWALERESQRRTPRPSAALYAAICRANALDTEDVARYAPQALPALLPGSENPLA